MEYVSFLVVELRDVDNYFFSGRYIFRRNLF